MSEELSAWQKYKLQQKQSISKSIITGYTKLVYGTKILMADGTYKKVEDIYIGDSIKTLSIKDADFPFTFQQLGDFNFSSSKVYNTVHKKETFTHNIYNQYFTSTSTLLTLRDSHLIKVFASDIKLHDKVLNNEADFVSIEKIVTNNLNIDSVSLDIYPDKIFFTEHLAIFCEGIK